MWRSRPTSNVAGPKPTRISQQTRAGRRCKYSFAGIWEIDPHGLEEHAEGVQILDVRETREFDGPLGHIRGARLIPLGELAERIGELAQDRPIVAVCRAGSRSAQATVILREAGFTERR